MYIDEKINNIENTLNHYTPYPIVIPGIIKAGLGLIQAITAISISLFLSMPALCGHHKSERLFVHSCKHITHGVGNMLSGSVEAIPILGAILYGLRILNSAKNSNPGIYSITSISTIVHHPDFKFYGYENIPVHEFIKYRKNEMNEIAGKKTYSKIEIPNE